MWKEFKGMGHGMIYFFIGQDIWIPRVLNGRGAAHRYVWKLLSGRQGKVEGLGLHQEKPIKTMEGERNTPWKIQPLELLNSQKPDETPIVESRKC